MAISNPSMPSVPDGLHVDDLTLDTAGFLIAAHTAAHQATCPKERADAVAWIEFV